METIKRWFEQVSSQIHRKLPLSIVEIGIVSFVVFILTRMLYTSFGWFTAFNYAATVVVGLPKILENNKRAVVWCVGFILGAIILQYIIPAFLPLLSFNITGIVSFIMLVVVAGKYHMESKRLKEY